MSGLYLPDDSDFDRQKWLQTLPDASQGGWRHQPPLDTTALGCLGYIHFFKYFSFRIVRFSLETLYYSLPAR